MMWHSHSPHRPLPFWGISSSEKLNRPSRLLDSAVDTVVNQPMRRQAGKRHGLHSLPAAAAHAGPTA